MMNDFLPAELSGVWLLPAALVVLLVIWIVIRRRRGRSRTLASVINAIAFERLQGLIIPKADEGEIQIDHLILTAQGLLIIEIKEVQGAVFGSDKMQDWTVIADDKRFTFNNPQPALYDRIAAVRQIVREVPVAGRIVFLDGASFTKGVPGMVCNIDELLEEFGEEDKAAAKVKIEAFRPHWEQIQGRADQPGGTGT
jgi:hypothetical protein